MWTRTLLKQNAKQTLARTFKITLLVALAYEVLSGGDLFTYTYNVNLDSNSIRPEVWPALFIGTGLGSLLAILISVFFTNPLIVGKNRYFMEARLGNAPFSSLFGLFHKGEYKNVVLVQLWTDLQIVLYTFLLIIPGIIKSYEYALVPYLLAENPNMSCSRAQMLSKQMMNGEKLNLWILQLSFFGWELLFTLVVAMLMQSVFLAWILSIVLAAILNAYIQATLAEFYAAMREKAFAMQYTNGSELGGFIVY